MPRIIDNPVLLAADIPPASCATIVVQRQAITVFNVDGEFYATQANCTHAGGPLCKGSMAHEVVMCPWHGSRFNVKTGEVVQDPAEEPLTTYPVTVQDGRIIIDVEG